MSVCATRRECLIRISVQAWGRSWYNFNGTPSDSSTDFAWQILVGVTTQFTKEWSADLGYRYFSTSPQTSSQVTLGVNYHF